MEIQCKRKTGFYGMASGIYITKNGQPWLCLQQNESKTVQLFEQKCELQACFFFLKSRAIYLVDTGKPIRIELIMNPILIWVYFIFFISLLLLPMLHVSMIGILVFFLLYCVFLYSMLKQAYLIKEIN